MLGYADLENEIRKGKSCFFSLENKERIKRRVNQVHRKKQKKKKRARVAAGIERDLEMGEELGMQVEEASRSNSDSRRCV